MQSIVFHELATRLDVALQARSSLLTQKNQGVLRLFNGFYEGYPELLVDVYANTLVLFTYIKDFQVAQEIMARAQAFYLSSLPFVDCVVKKYRSAPSIVQRQGIIDYGDKPVDWILEHGVRYALDLQLNQDASFYPDTRNLRKWLLDNSQEARVINFFAYTGSLGIAALAGGATKVHQVDLKPKYLRVAQKSLILNDFSPEKMSLENADFFSRVAFYKKHALFFDLVILDAPFFSTTRKGVVDLANQSMRLVNKVRPLLKDGGRLVVVNNALFLSGEDFYQSMQNLSQDGYLSIENIIPIPEDITGYPHTVVKSPPIDPSPFNHPTKILVLRVKRKQ